MGRELKRVPLDFDWPLNKPWQGFINPHYSAVTCVHCNGSGYSAQAKTFGDQWYGNAPFRPEDRGSVPFSSDHPTVIAMAQRNARPDRSLNWPGCNVDQEARRLAALFNRGWSHHLNQDDVNALVSAGRLMDLTHTWAAGEGWKPKEPAYIPTAQEVNEWSLRGFGHDSINQHVCIEARCAALGISHLCDRCKGHGDIWPSDAAKALYDDWQSKEPPAGDGYQIWETVSEGSPISPVFTTSEELASYMVANPWGADEGSSYESWMKFINGPGWAPSMVIADGVVLSGPDAVI